MYAESVRRSALEALASGLSLSEVSRRTGVNRSTLREWQDHPSAPRPAECTRCDDADLPPAAYAALLGFYLGDGCISRAARYYSMRVICDVKYPAIIDDVANCIRGVRPRSRVHLVPAPGCIVVQANWMHWPCLFPQHGPGRKHQRPILLADWQREVVEAHPADFLRGLFHSDGCRVLNWTTRVVAGHRKRYDYPRWQFANHSEDILQLTCWALDLAEVAWRRSSWKVISVSRREAVARLDQLIGPKA